MVKRVAIVQSSYIPWKGFFDILNLVDEYVVYDSAQFIKRSFRNRNQIKTSDGPQWLTIPVEVKGKYLQSIDEVLIAEKKWQKKHWMSIQTHYAKAPFFKEYRERWEHLFLDQEFESLSEVNLHFIKALAESFGIATPIRKCSDYSITASDPTEKLLEICKQMEATDYVSGPSAQDYFKTDLFTDNGVNVHFANYDGYIEYTQLHGDFNHFVSALDLLFNCGPDASKYMKTFGDGQKLI